MKKLLLPILIILSLLVFTNCGTRLMYAPEDLNKESNAELIESAASDAAAQIITIPFLNNSSNYVIVSAEEPEGRDNKLNSLIEDAITSVLTESGFPVLDRDKDVLLRIVYQEDKDSMKAVILPPEQGKKNESKKKDSQQKETVNTEIPKYDLDYGKKVQIIPTNLTPEIGNQNILTADYIIAYRILETGLKYVNINERDEYGLRQIKRQALVKLHVKLINAKNSKVVWAGMLSGLQEDLIPIWKKKELQKTDYKFYSHTSPLNKK